MKSITYEELLKTDACRLNDDDRANLMNLMKEIGRSKEAWTAVDIIAIEHEELTDEDKLCMVINAKLISKKQIGEVFILLMREALDAVLSRIKKEKDTRVWEMFSKALSVSRFNKCVNDMEGVMLLSKQSLVEHEGYTTLKEVKAYLISQITNRYDALRNVTLMLLDQNRSEEEKLEKEPDIDLLVHKYLIELSFISFVCTSALKAPKRPLLRTMNFVSHGIVAKYTGNPAKVLQTITTVVNRPEIRQVL